MLSWCAEMLCDLPSDPIVEAMGGAIHCGAKATTVKTGGVAALLHTFDDENVLFENITPLHRVLGTQGIVGLRGGIIKVDMFAGLFMGNGFEDDHECMVALHTQQDIGIESQVFTRFSLFFVEARKSRKSSSIVSGQWGRDGRSWG